LLYSIMDDFSFTRMVFDEPIVSLEVASVHSTSFAFSYPASTNQYNRS
jgi:hypothetical protein